MPNLKKVLAIKNDEELTEAEKKEREKRLKNEELKKDQQEYEKKVSDLLACCKKFDQYLHETYNDSDRWHLKFKEIFKEYLNSRKIFSRTKSVLKEIYKNFQYYTVKQYPLIKGEYQGKYYDAWRHGYVAHSDQFKKLKFKPKKPDRKGYIKRSAIDDAKVAEYFNKTLLESLVNAYDRQPQMHRLQYRSGFFVQEDQGPNRVLENETSSTKVERNIYANGKSFYNVGHSTLSDPFIHSKKVVIPPNVSIIPGHAFENFKNLEELTISKDVRIIQDYAFAGCEKLKSIVFDSSPTIWGYAFNGSDISLREITFLKKPPEFHDDTFGPFGLHYKPDRPSITIKVKRGSTTLEKVASAMDGLLKRSIKDKNNLVNDVLSNEAHGLTFKYI